MATVKQKYLKTKYSPVGIFTSCGATAQPCLTLRFLGLSLTHTHTYTHTHTHTQTVWLNWMG